jgi:3-oxoacyl-[acyl-carrier protein] reductase
MDLGLKGKVAVVTGSSRGIGKGIAASLAAEGCRLVLCARGKETLAETAAELRQGGTEVLDLTLDITRKEDALILREQTLNTFDKIDILVNSAGSNKRGLFEDTTDQDWRNIIDINLLCHGEISRLFIPAMKKQGSGVIIFISSIFGRESGGDTLSIYNSTKSAVISMAKVMAGELAAYGIRVNSVAPGSIRFPGSSWDKRCLADPQGMAKFVEDNLPIGRFGTLEEVADVVCFLASGKASLITGACLNVDGGQSRSLI